MVTRPCNGPSRSLNLQCARSLHAVKRLKWSRLAGRRIAVAIGRWKGNASQWPCWTNGDGEELNVKWGFLKPQMQPWRADAPLCDSCVRFKLEWHELRVGVAARLNLLALSSRQGDHACTSSVRVARTTSSGWQPGSTFLHQALRHGLRTWLKKRTGSASSTSCS